MDMVIPLQSIHFQTSLSQIELTRNDATDEERKKFLASLNITREKIYNLLDIKKGFSNVLATKFNSLINAFSPTTISPSFVTPKEKKEEEEEDDDYDDETSSIFVPSAHEQRIQNHRKNSDSSDTSSYEDEDEKNYFESRIMVTIPERSAFYAPSTNTAVQASSNELLSEDGFMTDVSQTFDASCFEEDEEEKAQTARKISHSNDEINVKNHRFQSKNLTKNTKSTKMLLRIEHKQRDLRSRSLPAQKMKNGIPPRLVWFFCFVFLFL
jgi:hypothetical protein